MNQPRGSARPWLGSTTLRLAVLLAGIQLATLALGLVIMTGLTRSTLTADARTAAQVARDDFMAIRARGGDAALIGAIGDRLTSPDDVNFVVFLRGADGRRIAGNLAVWPNPAPRPGQWSERELTRIGAGRADHVGFLIQPLPGGGQLLTGEVLAQQAQAIRASERAFLIAMLTGLMIAAGASWGILRVLERRIDHFSGAALAIAGGRLNTRITLTRTGDAFDRLGISINAMLERIEALVGELRVMTDSMAHDLRSPVARIRSALERSLGATQDNAARAALADAVDEVEGFQGLLDTALEISRAEAGIGRNQFSRFDLAAVLRDLAEVYGPLAEEEGFEIAVEAPAEVPVLAHRELLFRGISNLIDNCLKYAQGGSRIVLELAADDAQLVHLGVADDGPGIPEADRAEAQRRFGRLDPARTRSGAGLGLSLVSTIAALHGGTMTLDRAGSGGLKVLLSLPVLQG